MTPCVESQACHEQKAVSAASLIHSIHCLRRNRCTKTMRASGQKISPAWQRIIPATNLNLPSGVPQGVSDRGMKYHTGPVSRTIRVNKMMALDTMVAGKLGIDLPSSRLESYQIFSTADRCVNVFQGEKIARAMKAGNCNPDGVRR